MTIAKFLIIHVKCGTILIMKLEAVGAEARLLLVSSMARRLALTKVVRTTEVGPPSMLLETSI